MKETVYAVLKILVAVEIWQRSFSSLPRARVRVGFLLVAALSTTAAAVHTIPTDLHPYDTLMGILIPRFQAGTLILYATIVSASWWYRMPLHPFYRAIIMGFGAFLTVYTLLLSLLGVQSGSSRAGLWTAVLNAAAYIAVSTWWAWVAWRRAQAPSPIVARLQPWAKTW